MSQNSLGFGEVDWNSSDAPTQRASDFMKLEQGKTRVRIMGNPVQFYSHWVILPSGAKRKINSPASDPKLVKQLEDAGFKKGVKWLVKVLDRKEEKFKILEIGTQIKDGIKALVQDEDWGTITQYDVTIERGPEGQQPLYRVTPRPKQPLPDAIKEEYRSFNERVDLSKFTKPSEPDAIRELMGWTAQTAKPATQDDDEDMFSFEG